MLVCAVPHGEGCPLLVCGWRPLSPRFHLQIGVTSLPGDRRKTEFSAPLVTNLQPNSLLI